ncbi:MAG: LysM peptidoglycan-binding domain-containing protein [Nitrospiraceae bacterium]|nr:MAG: LysM peptidoglycan-binding domain-containing protein [Nitrospiraceae bacterium]
MKKMNIAIIASLLFFFSYAYAEDAASEEYTVRKNDTLWDISNTKLQDPFLWPKLWNINPQINNPDLIRPGDKIKIPSREEVEKEAAKATQPTTSEKKKPGTALKKQEAVRAEGKSAFEFPAEEAPKYIVSKNLFIASGWISETSPGIGEISATPSGRKIIAVNDEVYLSFSTEKILSHLGLKDKPSLMVAQNEKSKNRFFVIKDVKTVKHPETGKRLGRLIRIAGILQVIGMDDSKTRAKIISSFEDIHIGDGLLPYQEMEPPLIPTFVRTPEVEGYVVESFSSSQMSVEGSIIFLDKGRNDGLEAGDVFSVFSMTAESPVKRVIGKIQIISLQPATSAAIITESSQEILIGAKWGQE